MTSASALLAPVFVALYAGHQVGDHVAQTHWQSMNKSGSGRAGVRAMAGHILSYTLCQAVALELAVLVGVPLSAWAALAALVVSAGTHTFLDRRWPVRWIQEHSGSAEFVALADHGINGMYLTDQALHQGCLFLAAVAAAAIT